MGYWRVLSGPVGERDVNTGGQSQESRHQARTRKRRRRRGAAFTVVAAAEEEAEEEDEEGESWGRADAHDSR